MTQAALKDKAMQAAKASQKKFTTITGEFEDRGILNSEMLLVCSLTEAMGCDVLIESGRWRAQSTKMLADYFKGSPVQIESIELFRDANAAYVEEKMKAYKNVTLHYGDANYVVPRLVARHHGKKIAVLFDGPKGQQAFDVFRLALASTPITIGFFHDMRKPTPEMPNNERQLMEKQFTNAFFSDDADFIKTFEELDDSCQDELWKPNQIDGKPIGSYGPTIGVTVPTKADTAAAQRDRLGLWIITRRRLGLSLAMRAYHRVRDSIRPR